MSANNKETNIKRELTKEKLIALYMDHVLENGSKPKVIFKFAKDNDFEEEEFYHFFGSFEALEKGVWERFYEHTLDLLQKSSEFSGFSAREKLLTFFYTFFEIVSANRSYVLYTLRHGQSPLKKLDQLSILRSRVKDFARDIHKEFKIEEERKMVKTPGAAFAEGTWLQLLFLLKFWMDDDSPQFEKTDVAIEKSVNTGFALFDTSTLERVLDFGKFIWKEKLA